MSDICIDDGAAVLHRQNQIRSELLVRALRKHHGNYENTTPILQPEVVIDEPVAIAEVIPVDPDAEIMRHWSAINERKRAALLMELNTVSETQVPTMKEIIRETCLHFKVPKLGVLSVRRDRTMTIPRFVACYIAKEKTRMSFPAIGRALGNRDHTTALNAVHRVEQMIAEGSPIIADIDAIVERITANIETRQRLENEINADLRHHLASQAASTSPPDRAFAGAGSERETVLGAAE